MNVSEMIASNLRELGADGLVNLDEACGCDITDLQTCESRCLECVAAKRVLSTYAGWNHEPGDPIYVPIGDAHRYVPAPLPTDGDCLPNSVVGSAGDTRIDGDGSTTIGREARTDKP